MIFLWVRKGTEGQWSTIKGREGFWKSANGTRSKENNENMMNCIKRLFLFYIGNNNRIL